MDNSKAVTSVLGILVALIIAHFLNKKMIKTDQKTWFVGSPYWWSFGRLTPYTWQGYVVVFLFVVCSIFILLSHSPYTIPFFILLLVLYIFISYKTSRNSKNVKDIAQPSTFNPTITMFKKNHFLDRIMLVVVAVVIMVLIFGFLVLLGSHHS